MVNKGRSRGCGQCRHRKVKVSFDRSTCVLSLISVRFQCDEAKPSCQRCTKSGLQCPGYGTPRLGKEAGYRGSKSKTCSAPNEPPDPFVSDVRGDMLLQHALSLYFNRLLPCLRGNYFLELARDHYFALEPTTLLSRATQAVALNAHDIYRPQAHTRTMALEVYDEVVGLVKTYIEQTPHAVDTSFLLALCQLEVFEVTRVVLVLRSSSDIEDRFSTL